MAFCRICFTSPPKMLDLTTFLPVIYCLAQTKIPCKDVQSSKICNTCANGLIMANLFRVKVIESNQKYREFTKLKKEQEQEIMIETQMPSKDESIFYEEEQMSDDEMQVEFLNEFLNAVDEKKTAIQYVKTPQKKTGKQTIVKQSPKVVEESSNKLCFVCMEPGVKSLSPYKETLGRIVPVQNCNKVEYLCQKCQQKLEDAKTFFEKLDLVDETTKVKKSCCQFCANKFERGDKIPKSTMDIFNSLHDSGHKSRVKEDGQTCLICNQLLIRIRIIRNRYNAKENFIEKQNSTTKRRRGPGKKRKLSESFDMIDTSSQENESTSCKLQENLKISPRRKAGKRLRRRPNPKYVPPNPDEPIPEDYQCHMSDFEEIESDTEVPAVPFRSPLNVPFKHTYHNCPDCNLTFVNTCEMEIHQEFIHRTDCDVCDICNKAFKDVKTVRDHKFAVHGRDFSAFNFRKLCDICGQVKRKFENHYAIHFDERQFKCKLCTCDYKTKAALEDHIRTVHMGEKRHKCGYCDKRFGYAADKARHEISVHTKKFKHICQFCGKCFIKKNFMTSHQKAQHAQMYLEMTNMKAEQE